VVLGNLETKPALVTSWEIILSNTYLETLMPLKEYLWGEIAHHLSELFARFSRECALLQCMDVACLQYFVFAYQF